MKSHTIVCSCCSVIQDLYATLERVDEDAAFEWATKNVGEDDMWIVRACSAGRVWE